MRVRLAPTISGFVGDHPPAAPWDHLPCELMTSSATLIKLYTQGKIGPEQLSLQLKQLGSSTERIDQLLRRLPWIR